MKRIIGVVTSKPNDDVQAIIKRLQTEEQVHVEIGDLKQKRDSWHLIVWDLGAFPKVDIAPENTTPVMFLGWDRTKFPFPAKQCFVPPKNSKNSARFIALTLLGC